MTAQTLTGRFGAHIKALRLERNLTQQDLGRQVGMSRSSIANIEAGRQNLGIEQLEVLAIALDIGIGDLFADDGLPQQLVDVHERASTALARAESAAVDAVRDAFAAARRRNGGEA